MISKTSRILLFTIGLLKVALVANAQSESIGEQTALSLRGNVVKITGAEKGFGFIVSETENELLIVTADHVVRGESYEGLLFSVDLLDVQNQGMLEELDKGNISKNLRYEFDFNGVLPPSDKATVSAGAEDDVWWVRDGKRLFVLEKKNDRLAIDIKHVEVEFFGVAGDTVEGKLLSYRSSPDNGTDMAVLTVDSSQIRSGFSWDRRSMGSPENVGRGMQVWFVGQFNDWHVPTRPGRVFSVEEVTMEVPSNGQHVDKKTIVRVDGLTATQGVSGAPLISEVGIIGMFLERTGGTVTKTLRIDTIREQILDWHLSWDLKIPVRWSAGGTGSISKFIFFPGLHGEGLVLDGYFYGGLFVGISTDIGRANLSLQFDFSTYLAGGGVLMAPGITARLRYPWKIQVQPGLGMKWYVLPDWPERNSLVFSFFGAYDLDLVRGLTLIPTVGFSVGWGDIAKGLDYPGLNPFIFVNFALYYDFVFIFRDLKT